MLRDFRIGAGTYFRAFGFAMKHRLGWAFVVPVLLWILLYAVLFAVVWKLAGEVGAWAGGFLEIPLDAVDRGGWRGFWDDVKAFFNATRELLITVVVKLALLYVTALINKYIVLIVLSPLLAYVSERAEEAITGRGIPFSMRQWMKDMLRGALIAMRNGVLEGLITAAIWILTLFVPLLAPVSLVLLFLVSAYFYGFSMFDYVFERRRLRVGASVKAVNARVGAVIANGALFALLMKIPLLGLCLAPAMGAIGAVLALNEERPGNADDLVKIA